MCNAYNAYTGNTYIMIVMTGKYALVPTTLLQVNIAAARKQFEKLIPEHA